MKKVYEVPSVEKVEFQYRDQVVVASGEYMGGSKAAFDGGDCIAWDNQVNTDACSTVPAQ